MVSAEFALSSASVQMAAVAKTLAALAKIAMVAWPTDTDRRSVWLSDRTLPIAFGFLIERTSYSLNQANKKKILLIFEFSIV